MREVRKFVEQNGVRLLGTVVVLGSLAAGCNSNSSPRGSSATDAPIETTMPKSPETIPGTAYDQAYDFLATVKDTDEEAIQIPATITDPTVRTELSRAINFGRGQDIVGDAKSGSSLDKLTERTAQLTEPDIAQSVRRAVSTGLMANIVYELQSNSKSADIAQERQVISELNAADAASQTALEAKIEEAFDLGSKADEIYEQAGSTPEWHETYSRLNDLWHKYYDDVSKSWSALYSEAQLARDVIYNKSAKHQAAVKRVADDREKEMAACDSLQDLQKDICEADKAVAAINENLEFTSSQWAEKVEDLEQKGRIDDAEADAAIRAADANLEHTSTKWAVRVQKPSARQRIYEAYIRAANRAYGQKLQYAGDRWTKAIQDLGLTPPPTQNSKRL